MGKGAKATPTLTLWIKVTETDVTLDDQEYTGIRKQRIEVNGGLKFLNIHASDDFDISYDMSAKEEKKEYIESEAESWGDLCCMDDGSRINPRKVKLTVGIYRSHTISNSVSGGLIVGGTEMQSFIESSKVTDKTYENSSSCKVAKEYYNSEAGQQSYDL